MLLGITRIIRNRVFPYTLGIFSINEYLLVLWCNSYNTAERVFPCALGTFSVKEREYMATSTLGAIRIMRQRESESVSLYFGYI